ncbi:O-antigen ligase family protein [Modestobacter sp. I12A-02662]|uniref:O-antigen ligase family protein n=1 Tax=Modestobacter sp. I12A-02662 TaxID=1730496 RepID=UPI0034DEB33D
MVVQEEAPGAGRALVPFAGRHRYGWQPPGGPGRVVLVAIALGLGLAALVNPKGPGRLGPVDVVMATGIVAAVLWALRARAAVRMPYVLPMAGLMTAGLIAALVGPAPIRGVQSVVQEIFLLLWCAAIATVCCSPRALAFALRAWALTATGWAALLVVAVLIDERAISGAGTTASDDPNYVAGLSETATRARLFFDHPNMAGNFFMIAVFIVVASGFPRALGARVGACGVLVTAMFLTGSNAALLSLLVGGGATFGLYLWRRRGVVVVTAVAALTFGVVGVAVVEVAPLVLATAADSDNEFIRNSLGRGARSAEARESLFSSQLDLYQRGNLLGVGPSSTRDVLGAETATTVKQAHNDYLATLVERGPLGVLSLIGLIGVIWLRVARFAKVRLPPGLNTAVPVPAALAGACLAFACTALTHEILHYRWLWSLLGVVAAVELLARRGSVGPGPLDVTAVPGVR